MQKTLIVNNNLRASEASETLSLSSIENTIRIYIY